MFELFKDGGVFTGILLVCSVISLAFILERIWALRRNRIMPPELLNVLNRDAEPVEDAWLRSTSESRPSPLGRLILTMLDYRAWPRAENASAVEVHARQEVVGLERGLIVLEVITGIAPLLGLVGTIYGIIPLFGDFGKAISGDQVLIAKGIGAALNKTLLGLMVAIPSLVAWSLLNKRVEELSIDLSAHCDAFLRRNYPPESR
ncbi:MAG: MotA/TolQ/ExbB proton channel family protein [Pedosphaera sp.]|nr:MotA/TolQ/ExbB proton channel family protein [Pedosphaera sp.]